jgi:hypothetical protein
MRLRASSAEPGSWLSPEEIGEVELDVWVGAALALG